MSTSVFETPELERSLFFPCADPTSPPPGAIDRLTLKIGYSIVSLPLTAKSIALLPMLC